MRHFGLASTLHRLDRHRVRRIGAGRTVETTGTVTVEAEHYARRVVGRDLQIADGLDGEFRRAGSSANGALMARPGQIAVPPLDFEQG